MGVFFNVLEISILFSLTLSPGFLKNHNLSEFFYVLFRAIKIAPKKGPPKRKFTQNIFIKYVKIIVTKIFFA
jgi:hypothetical protein